MRPYDRDGQTDLWDVIVIGAAPAGASSAYFLARSGVKVLLVDQKGFPREKVCGDGVSSEGLALLEQMGLGDWVIQKNFLEPHRLLLSSPDGSSVTIDYNHSPFSYGRVIPRYILDEALVTQAAAKGACLLERYRISHCEHVDGKIRVEGNLAGRPQSHEARLAIIAEGAQASLTRKLGLIKGPPDLVAVRGYFSGACGSDETLEIHYERSIAPGYAWVFPLGNGRVNVGLGTFVCQVKRKRINLGAVFERVISENPYLRRRLRLSEPESPVKGYPLRTNLSKCRLYSDNILVAGEAAHLVNPLTGEGIASALESGRMAAQQAERALKGGDFSAAGLARYSHEIEKRYAADYRAALFIRCLLRCKPVMNRLVRKAYEDDDLAKTIGLAIIGVTSPGVLLKPSMMARYLF